ncbi:MAG: transcription-repair coupling factor, partial [Pseudomonadota bacterium]
MTDIQQILESRKPLTLAGAPTGFLPSLMSDLARAAAFKDTPAVYIAPDDTAMRGLADAVRYFAPEIDIVVFPAWDCLPYDRASPSLRISAERLAALHQLQRNSAKPRVIATTINAVTQRTLSPFRIRQLVTHLAPGERIDRDDLTAKLQANGYIRVESVADSGEYAVRGGILDLFPSGEKEALRLDFFGDEIESIRRFDPADQRTVGRAESFTLLPASEALLDAENIKRFRGRYRELFGATATGDPLYQAISEGRRLAGMEHWLPLFEDGLATVFDHLDTGALHVRDSGTPAAAEARFESITDYHQNRENMRTSEPGSYRPLDPDTLYLPENEWQAAIAEAPLHLTSPFREPDSDTVVDMEVGNARDFAPERKANANIYEAVVSHIETLRKDGKTVVLGSYSRGARERLGGLLEEHGLTGATVADDWQTALGGD